MAWNYWMMCASLSLPPMIMGVLDISPLPHLFVMSIPVFVFAVRAIQSSLEEIANSYKGQ